MRWVCFLRVFGGDFRRVAETLVYALKETLHPVMYRKGRTAKPKYSTLLNWENDREKMAQIKGVHLSALCHEHEAKTLGDKSSEIPCDKALCIMACITRVVYIKVDTEKERYMCQKTQTNKSAGGFVDQEVRCRRHQQRTI